MFTPNPSVYGGTEHMAKLFKDYVMDSVPELENYYCIIAPGYLPPLQEVLESDKKVILWIHNPFNQFEHSLLYEMSHPLYLEKIAAVVVVSNYLKALVVSALGINKEKVHVIYNVVEPVYNNVERFKQVDKVKAIYTSSADRGLEILIQAMPFISEDFEVNIFSNFYPELSTIDVQLDSRLNFYGTTPHKTVRKHLAESHIFAYPCQFDETFCISLGEAISANCLPVHSDQRALVEIGNLHGMVYRLEQDDHVQLFAKTMTEAIKRIKTNAYDPKDSAKIINERFSLDKFIQSWITLSKSL